MGFTLPRAMIKLGWLLAGAVGSELGRQFVVIPEDCQSRLVESLINWVSLFRLFFKDANGELQSISFEDFPVHFRDGLK